MSSARLMVRSPTINVMTMAAEKAGRAMIRDFNEIEHLQVSKKSLGDFVSTADHRSEKILVAELRKARPSYSFLLQESGTIEGSDSEYRGIIDPIDGTTNFLHGIPHFAISIGLQRGDDIVAGVIYNPATDEMYWTERGHGSFLNQRRLRVSGRKNLDEVVVAVGGPYGAQGDVAQYLQTLSKIIPQTAGIRRMGATALDFAFVAAGRFDACFATDFYPWDVAAGILMVKEAGGYVNTLDGTSDALVSASVLATNEHLCLPLQKMLTD
ncbi:MAG: inositol monophosphatase family protein [Alphaproteobacteria bacterium]